MSARDRLREDGRRLRIFTWHVHGNYLYYLSQVPHDWFLPVGRPEPGYAGAAPGFPWPASVQDVPADRVRDLDLDCILFQSKRHYLEDQYELFSERQRRLPRIYLEHDPPWDHPANARHVVDDPEMLLVHVTWFNRLMWDSGRTPVRVIEHGVLVPEEARYRGELERGLVVINNLARRGRLLGLDLFTELRRRVPLDLIGMDAEAAGGIGEISHEALPAFMSRYRFLFNPIRYTSLGLAVCEAMTVGLPVVGLATTEMATAVPHDVAGYVDTNPDRLVERMQVLLRHPEEARRLSRGARDVARARFGIGRFAREWDETLRQMAGRAADGRPPRLPERLAELSPSPGGL